MITSIRNLINTEDGTYQFLVYKSWSKLFAADMDQIDIFQQWNQTIYIKVPTFTEAYIINKLTEM